MTKTEPAASLRQRLSRLVETRTGLIAASWVPVILAAAIAAWFLFSIHQYQIELRQNRSELSALNEKLESGKVQLHAVEIERSKATREVAILNKKVSEAGETVTTLERTIATLNEREESLRKAATLNDPAVAIQRVREQLAKGTKGQRADLLFRQGSDALAKKDLDAAEQFFSEAVKEDATFAPAFNGLGLVAADKRDLSTAERYYLLAVGVQPRYAHGWYNLANLSLMRHNPKKAQEYLSKTLEADPEYKDDLNVRQRIETATQKTQK